MTTARGVWGGGQRPRSRGGLGGTRPPAGLAQVRLATWHQLLDSGRMQDGEPYLAGTARPVVARMSAATAAEAGLADGDKVTVATGQGSVTVPSRSPPMADHVVWLPGGAGNQPGGSTIRAELGAGHGATVTLRRPE
jgi:NADH-quinone oxidoreductase subunit G